MVRRLSLGLLSVILASCADGKTPDANSVDVLTHPFVGCWEDGTGLQREGWTVDPSGWAIGYGANRDADGKVTFFEHMRIETGPPEVLVVSGQDGSTVRFPRQATGDTAEFRFENAAHDFPQVIVYKQEGDRLNAYISTLNGENKVTFDKTRCEGLRYDNE